MSRLTKILEYSTSSPREQKKLLDRPDFPADMKELLLSTPSESSDLVRTEVIGAVIEGAKSRESARKLLPIINTNSNTGKIVFGTTPSGQYAPYVAEGAATTVITNNYSSGNISIKKAAVRPCITTEMIEDGKYDVIELELRRAGALLENKLNQEVMTTLLDGVSGPTDIDPTTHITIENVGEAKGNIDQYGWMADSVFLQPKAFGWMYDEANVTDIVDGTHNLFGLKATVVDCVTDGTGTAYWDATNSSNHYYGLVFDSYNFAYIAMREDINVKEYDDPIHDIIGMNVSMRFDVGIINASAGCRILAK